MVEVAHDLKERLTDVGHRLEHRLEDVAGKLMSPLRTRTANDYSHLPRHASDEELATLGHKKEGATGTADDLPRWVHEPDHPISKVDRLQMEEEIKKAL